MKKFTIILALLLIISGCNLQTIPNKKPIENNTNKQIAKEQQKQTEINKKPQIKELITAFNSRLFPVADVNLKVKDFNTKEALINFISQVSSINVATSYIKDYYVEKTDGLYKEKKKKPILLNIALPYTVKQKSDEEYDIYQDQEVSNGIYHIQVKLSRVNSKWLISNIQVDFEKKGPDISESKDLQSILLLVNKTHSIPANYVPKDLVEVKVPFYFSGKSEKKLLRKEAAEHLEQLFNKALEDNIHLYGASGYRSYKTQDAIFAYNVQRYGSDKEANKVSAHPGQSEHQTGLAIDLTAKSVNFHLIQGFGNTLEGKWLKENAANFGFIIRYPKGKEAITGYTYEPWHVRYVGLEVAKEIAKEGITLEEYFHLENAVQVDKNN